MIGFTHVSLALLLGSLFFRNDGFAMFLVIIGSLLPDIDYPFSLIGQFFQRIIFWLNENYGHGESRTLGLCY
ncbi:hypothetical protein COT72_05005 [archaeon CG10_big_fil_rev_8_21_14_0_10_43_11]|nr:MAG: hypothetical protein COT72_05005 [archaeon CG10_big_fil_rev_8_21_14_0_10_43_11]